MQNERDTKYAPFAKVLWDEIAKDSRIYWETPDDEEITHVANLISTPVSDIEEAGKVIAQDIVDHLEAREKAGKEIEEAFHAEMITLIARKLYEWREHGWDRPGWPPESTKENKPI
jgi:hypothetical protein